MKRRDFLKVTGMATAATSLSVCAGAGDASNSGKPNIVYIMLDEWGYYEWSGAGHKKLITPNIDKMAKEGMQFTHCLAGGPVCAPTRSVLMTGQHLGHTTVRGNSGTAPIRKDDVTIASVLKKAGYVTGGFGKWGLGTRGTSGVPEKHGFDIFFGYYDQVHAHTYYPPYLIRNSQEVPLKGNTGDYYVGETHAHVEIFKESIKFIKENKDNPFFCYLPWTPPHGLWGFPKDDPSWQLFKDKKGWDHGQRNDDDAKVYAAMMHMIDRQLGEINDLLKKLNIADNTIIYMCGDNGGQDYFKSKEHPDGFFEPHNDPKTGKRILKGGKGSLYEGGLRIPFFVKWPGKVKAGAVSDHLSYFPDVMPTLCDLAGVKTPERSDGISMLPSLLGEGEQKQHKYLYWEQGKNWKAVREGKWKLHRKGKSFELHDLDKDGLEENNIADKHPDIVKRLDAYIQEAHEENSLGEVYDKELSIKSKQSIKKKAKK